MRYKVIGVTSSGEEFNAWGRPGADFSSIPEAMAFAEKYASAVGTVSSVRENDVWIATADDGYSERIRVVESSSAPHLDEGGVVVGDGVDAVVHEGEAIIPLETAEGQEVINEAVSEAASEAIGEAAETIADAEQLASEAIREEVQEAVIAHQALSAEMRASFDAYIMELNSFNEPALPDPAPVDIIEPTEDEPPEHSHWFFRPMRRTA